ncbi:MAG: PhoH family protein [Candidatus Aphodousia sp.]|nr:PhoH family protein [Candidatus Aphodousia sp.]
MAEEEKVLSLTLDLDNTALASLVGPMDANIRQIEVITETTISRRNQTFRIAGSLIAAREAMHALQVLAQKASEAGEDLTSDDVQLFFVGENAKKQDGDSVTNAMLHTKRRELQGRTPRQNDYIQAILDHDIAFGIGPAGTGKTYLAVAAAVDAYERDRIERIILTRPAVEAGERLGFLPGDLSQKVDPYLRPLYDALFDLLGFDKTQRLLERQTIEIAPLAYMRGRTLNNAFVILDEAQNTTPEQMKMFLTRIGFGSKAVITGDVTQIDLPRGMRSGLVEAQHVLAGVRGIAMTYFTAADVVRHPLVARIVQAYAKADEERAKARKEQKE